MYLYLTAEELVEWLQATGAEEAGYFEVHRRALDTKTVLLTFPYV